jgi:hypothetical protein
MTDQNPFRAEDGTPLPLLPTPEHKRKLDIELVEAERPEEAWSPPLPITTDVDLTAYPLHDRVAHFAQHGFTGEEATVFFQAFQAQSCDRVPRDELSSTVTVRDPYLVRFIVRRKDAGPIRVVVGGRYEVVDVDARAACVHGILLVPGAPVTVEPPDAILLGMRLSPRQCIEWYGAASDPERASVMSDPLR